MPQLWDTLTDALQGRWQFIEFTDSRWFTVGTSCRHLLAALMSGFDDCVQYARNGTDAPDTWRHLYGRMIDAIKQ